MTTTDPEIHDALVTLASHHQPDVERGLQAVQRPASSPSAMRRTMIAAFALLLAAAAGVLVFRTFSQTGSTVVPATETAKPTEVILDDVSGQILVSAGNGSGTFDVYSVAADGSNIRPLLSGPEHRMQAVLSPDGSRIAFVGEDRNGACYDTNIYVADADGSNAVRLTGDPGDLSHCRDQDQPNTISGVGQSDMEPAWSPNGQQIAWRTNCETETSE